MANNLNQTVYDPFVKTLKDTDVYAPIKKIRTTLSEVNRFILNAPPSYLTCEIKVKYNYKTDSGQDTSLYDVNIPILFLESFSESLSASYAKESPVGSTNPIVAFSHTNPQQIPITFIALDDYLPRNFKSLKDYVSAIKTMVKPKYIADGRVVAPDVELWISNMVYKVVCDNIDINYSNVFGTKSLVHATISCSFTVLKEES